MAGKLLRAVQYSGYGGGAAALKLNIKYNISKSRETSSLKNLAISSRSSCFICTSGQTSATISIVIYQRPFSEISLSQYQKHVEVPAPSPNKGEVLIKVEATSINPFDWKIQKGVLRPFLPKKFPFIPCTDVAGEIVEIGAGVTKFKAGDKVVAKLSIDGGGLAEYAVASESLTVPRPPEVSAAEGAALPIAGLTAHQTIAQAAGIKLDGSGPRKNILVTAASGGVGMYAVQLAKLGNAHVTATCGARNIDLVKGLGADEVLDYNTPDGAALKSRSGLKYDAVIHCTTGIPWSTFEPNLSENGKVIDITPNACSFLTFALKKLTFSKKQLVPLIWTVKGENLDYLVKLVKDGKLKTVIDSKYPLSKAEDAWAKSMEGHATGKIIVET